MGNDSEHARVRLSSRKDKPRHSESVSPALLRIYEYDPSRREGSVVWVATFLGGLGTHTTHALACR